MAGERDASDRPARRICAWCLRAVASDVRRDALFCSKRCRQASHRFGKGAPARVACGRPLRLAYADPPYPGLSRRRYGNHRDFAGEVDHAELVRRLVDEFPDGWALSTSARALPDVLALCPRGVRVGAWLRGACGSFHYRPMSAWEPVIYSGGRARLTAASEPRLDALYHWPRARRSDPAYVIGAKPPAFCWWMFDLLGALPGDALVDLFPGSGGVARAWDVYCTRRANLDLDATRREDPRPASPRSSATRRAAPALDVSHAADGDAFRR